MCYTSNCFHKSETVLADNFVPRRSRDHAAESCIINEKFIASKAGPGAWATSAHDESLTLTRAVERRWCSATLDYRNRAAFQHRRRPGEPPYQSDQPSGGWITFQFNAVILCIHGAMSSACRDRNQLEAGRHLVRGTIFYVQGSARDIL
jgi:hypothetical protein